MSNPVLALVERWLCLRVGYAIAIVVMALPSAPQVAEAQRPAGIARIGVLESSSPKSFPDRLEAAAQALWLQMPKSVVHRAG